jgi:hypothetical protein
MARANRTIRGVHYSASFEFQTKKLAKERAENCRVMKRKVARIGKTVFEK